MMNYEEHIQKAIRYIEKNLKYDIDLNAAASAAGYSMYHFLRIFKEVTHLTPANYIRKRRISEISRELERNCTISDLAFEYGFNSKENFTRAFKAEHHILPTEYKAAQSSLKLYEPFVIQTLPLKLEPEIQELSEIRITAYRCNERYPFHFWNQYNSRKFSQKLSGGIICEDFGISDWNAQLKKLDYYIGIPTEAALGDTEGAVEIVLPAGSYAVFKTPPTSHFNFVNVIHETWNYINTKWIPDSQYKRLSGYEFETYCEESRLFRERIYIPLERKEI